MYFAAGLCAIIAILVALWARHEKNDDIFKFSMLILLASVALGFIAIVTSSVLK